MNKKIIATLTLAFLIVVSGIGSILYFLHTQKEEQNVPTKANHVTTPPVAIAVKSPADVTGTPDTTHNRYISTDKLMKNLDDYFNIQPVTKVEKTVSSKASPHPNQVNDKISNIRNLLENLELTQDLTGLNNQIIEFLEDRDIPRSDKIYTLWNLATQFQIDSEKGSYLLDYLSSLQPIELTKEFIDTFSSNVSDARKIQLLRVLQSSFGMASSDKLTREQLAFVAEQSELIQQFFTSQLQSPTNPTVFREALLLYPSLVPSEQATSVIREVLANHGDKISDQDIITVSLDVAFTTNENQAKFLPDLIKSFQASHSSSNPTQQYFNERLYATLRLENAAEFISDDIRPQLAEYIKTQEPQLSVDTPISFDVLHNYYSWVDSYSSAISKTPVERAEVIANAVSNATDPVRQASILVFAKPEVISSLQNDNRITGVENSLRKALDNPQLSEDGKKLIQDALQEISSH